MDKLKRGLEKVPIRWSFWHSDIEVVVAIVTVLIIFGMINVFSSSFVKAESDYGNPYFFVNRQGIALVVSVIACYGLAKCDYHKIAKFMPFITIGIIISLICVLIFGEVVNGSKRWIALFGISALKFQPAEFAKLCCIILMSNYLSYYLQKGAQPKLLNIRNLFIAIMALLVLVEPDTGTSFIIIGIPLALAYIVGLTKMELRGIGGFIFLAIIALMLTDGYRMERLKVWFDPFSEALKGGYQTVQSLTAIGSGGLWGMGLGRGTSKYFDLPEAHTDFAFAVFSQENGYLFVILIVILYAVLCKYILKIASLAKDIYGQLLATGIMFLIIGQAVANMLMVSGILPVIGIPLPFISYGGSSLLVNMMAIGILLNISHNGRVAQKKRLDRLKREDADAKRNSRAYLKTLRP